jgi:putative transposase
VALRAFLRAFSTKRPRWGWRRAAKQARREGWRVNNKRIHRLWQDEGLRVPSRKRKKPHRGIGTALGAMCPIAPNVLWALDFQFDTTDDNRILKLLNIVDEFTRECPAIVVERCIDADLVVATLDRIVFERGAPGYVRFDNGPEFIAHAVRTGVASTTSSRSSSTPVRRGRTPGSKASTAGYATSSSTAGVSTVSSKPK